MADEELIDDTYQLVMCVASGSNSQVWEVTEKGSGRHLAMKLLKKEVPEFKANKAKMKFEATVLKSLEHPLIVKFDKFTSNRDHTYIIMEYFRASNLKMQIKNETNKVHMRARQLFEGVCSALSHVHQKGYVHRDIKPDNVLLNRAGEVRLCDFSLAIKEAKGIGAMFAGRPKEIEGTRTYIAPETIRKQRATSRTDLYSLGVMFFEILTGKPPFPATSPEELLQKHLRAEPSNASFFNPNVAPEMDRLIARLLKKKPADRPANVDEVLAEIRKIKIFKEDIIDEDAKKKLEENKNAIQMLSELRLDSRADAKLREMVASNPEFAKQFEAEKQKKLDKKNLDRTQMEARIKKSEDADAAKKAKKPGAKPAAAAPAPAQVQPQPMPQPMQPQMPMPGYPMPGYPGMPQTYAPYGQMPAGMPPGMYQPMPGMPQFPMQPGAPMPQTPAAAPPAQRPPAPGAGQPQAAPPAARPPVPPQSAAPPPRPLPQGAIPPQRPPLGPPPANPAAAAPSRPPQKPAQPAQPAADLDFMTDLPDVI